MAQNWTSAINMEGRPPPLLPHMARDTGTADGPPRAVALGEIEMVRSIYDPAVSVLPSAALHGHTAIVAFLLARGADPNAGFPLHHAARNGHLDAARLLIDGGADPSLLDEWHQSTPLGWAELQGQTQMCSFLRNRLS